MNRVGALLLFLASALGGCAWRPHQPRSHVVGNGKVTIAYVEEFMAGQVRPVIEGTINQMTGKFLIDTGASEPVLTAKAIRLCGIPLRKKTESIGTIGDRFPTEVRKVEGDVKVQFGPNVTVRWSDAYVTDGIGSELWLGILDYRTLQAANAVIDLERKTVTFSFPQK